MTDREKANERLWERIRADRKTRADRDKICRAVAKLSEARDKLQKAAKNLVGIDVHHGSMSFDEALSCEDGLIAGYIRSLLIYQASLAPDAKLDNDIIDAVAGIKDVVRRES